MFLRRSNLLHSWIVYGYVIVSRRQAATLVGLMAMAAKGKGNMVVFSRVVVALAGVLALTAALAQPAAADVSLVDTDGYTGTDPSITVNGETFTKSSCTTAICSDLVMDLDGTNTGIVIEDATSGTPFLSCTYGTNCTDPNATDLSMQFTISSATQAIASVSLGSVNGTAGVTVGKSVDYSGGTGSNSATTSAGDEYDLPSPAGTTTVDLDVNLNPSQRGSGTISVTSVTQDVTTTTPVPEPASVSLVVFGLVAAGAARRAKRRA